jgi:RNA polymerase sigma-70 factor, ECF subfamily
MATDATRPYDSLAGFALTDSGAVSTRHSRLEDEVVALFDQFRMPVLRYLLSLRIPIHDAEELAQEVFLALFRHLRRGKSRSNLRGWIFKVAHTSALKWRIESRRYTNTFSDSPVLPDSADRSLGPEERLIASQHQQHLLSVMKALPELDQCCLSLRAEGLRYREIADVLGIALGSVAASLEKSLSRLTRAAQRGHHAG